MPNFPDDLKTEFLFDARIDLAAAEQIGAVPQGARSVHIVTGGTFEGPRLRGEVLPGGGDWLLSQSDGLNELDVRVTLRADDGALILVTYRGILDLPADVARRALDGEDVDASEYYFRTSPRFETGAEQHAWLNRIVCVGTGWFAPGKVAYRVFAIR